MDPCCVHTSTSPGFIRIYYKDVRQRKSAEAAECLSQTFAFTHMHLLQSREDLQSSVHVWKQLQSPGEELIFCVPNIPDISHQCQAQFPTLFTDVCPINLTADVTLVTVPVQTSNNDPYMKGTEIFSSCFLRQIRITGTLVDFTMYCTFLGACAFIFLY